MIMDQNSAFMSSLMSYLFKKLGISIKTVGPYNQKSLQAEHGIKSLSNILSKWFDRSGTNMAQISITSHIHLQYISHTQFGKLFSI